MCPARIKTSVSAIVRSGAGGDQALLPGVPQPEQGHPVALLKSHGAHRLADGAGGRMRGNDQVPTAQLQIVDGPRVMDQQCRFVGAALLRVDHLGGSDQLYDLRLLVVRHLDQDAGELPWCR